MSTSESPRVVPHAPRRRPTLTITAGPLSSGKSSWVRSFRTEDGTTLCIVRDEVRAEVGGEGYLDGPVDSAIEEGVTARIQDLAMQALADGRDVYIDGCNNHPLTRSRWESLATASTADFRLMFFNLTLEQITSLNARRESPHPMAKVESSYRFWGEQFKKVADQPRPQHHFINGDLAGAGNGYR